jgi:hypothetical protein
MNNVSDLIRQYQPCYDALKWAENYTTPEDAWRECKRGDWMLWILGRLSGPPEGDSRKKLVLCACECARIALPLFERRWPGDNRVRKCLDTAERWARGDATIQELREARRAAADAAYTAHAYAAAAYAADAAAAYAADAADAAAAAYAAADAAYAAADAAYAAYAAAYSYAAYTYAAYAAAARTEGLVECANIVRKHYPNPLKLMEQ